MKVGDVFEQNGKKYVVTFSDGKNYSYAPVVEEATDEEPKRRGRKKNDLERD